MDAHAKRVCSERFFVFSALIGAFSAQNSQPMVAHAQRVCSERFFVLSAPIGTISTQNNQPLVVQVLAFVRMIGDTVSVIEKPRLRLLHIIGPGILVAATGVGAGDLATGALSGSKLGVAVLWAVVVGAVMKFTLTEGLARWQLATGETLLAGCVKHFGPVFQVVFLFYLLLWSVFVGSALMSACGVTAHAILPMLGPEYDKILFGVIHSVVAVAMIKIGGYRLFEKVMRVCIALMFVTVIATAVAIQPDWFAVARGVFAPTIPDADGEGIAWTVALMGGVGGTLTILCYGYWIREEGRTGSADIRICRIDLAAGYIMTALFGIGMVILGSGIETQGSGATLVVQLGDELLNKLGPVGPTARWAFLIGAWGAVFSSLLGVWQSVPYVFADFCNLSRKVNRQPPKDQPIDQSLPYQIFLYALATVPALGLLFDFSKVQKYYAIVGAAFMPLLAVVLLVMNGRKKWVGPENRNSPLTVAVLLATLVFFATSAWFVIKKFV